MCMERVWPQIARDNLQQKLESYDKGNNAQPFK
jgi:hypothetical protein